MATVEITADTIEQTIEEGGIVLLDFWASWCGPCRQFGPTFEKVSEDYPEIVFGKINTEQEQSLAASFGINSIPTIMAFRDGIGIFNQPGALPEASLRELIQQIEALDMNDVRKQIEEAQK
ncbi:MAG: thioredoxin [Actinomycetaceae bacterium]|nr:thioredoxin [Actinomycetaceae bacterium]